MLTDQMISTVIREVDTTKFNSEAHGPGQLVSYNLKHKSASIREGSFFDRFKFKKNEAFYFLKSNSKAVIIENITFTWKEGTNNIALDFLATFQFKIDTKNLDEYKSLVESLHNPQGVGIALYEIIDGCVDQVLSDIYRRSQTHGEDLLSIFYKAGVLHHDSIELNNAVSQAVQSKLGITNFNIGLHLIDLPPQYLEIKCETPLDIRDVENRTYKVKTKADIEISNYQLYKIQRFDSNKDINKAIEASIKQDIDRAVRKHVFNFGYFDLIESFYTSTVSNASQAISKLIEADIKTMVANKGYSIKLFHTLCDIPPLVLIDQGMRFTMSQESHQFKTKDSNLPIGLNLTLSLHLSSFKKVKSLIKPEHDTDRIRSDIMSQIAMACNDVLTSASIYEFDLVFDESLRQPLIDSLHTNLTDKYGFSVEIITMQPILSENKERLDALINESRPFALEISAQADSGDRDIVNYEGAFIVTGMDQQGYHRFVSKDYGFCKSSSKRSDIAYKKLASAIKNGTGQSFDINSESFEQEWKRHCIDIELQNIASGIQTNAEEYFSKESEVAAKTRHSKASEQLRDITEGIGLTFTRAEFGLEIEVTQFKRLDTDTEKENASVRDLKRENRRIYLENDAKELKDKLESDAAYRNQALDLKSKALNQAYAEDDLSREDIEREIRHNDSNDRDALFEELEQERNKSIALTNSEETSLLDDNRYTAHLDHKKDYRNHASLSNDQEIKTRSLDSPKAFTKADTTEDTES